MRPLDLSIFAIIAFSRVTPVSPISLSPDPPTSIRINRSLILIVNLLKFYRSIDVLIVLQIHGPKLGFDFDHTILNSPNTFNLDSKMVNSEEQQSMSDSRIDEIEDPVDLSNGDIDADNSTSSADPSARGLRTSSMRSSSISGGSVLTERLTSFFVDGGDVDLLLSRNDRADNLLQWLRALDVHLMGACRADERLKPMFKLNVSTGVAEDRLLAHLSQVILNYTSFEMVS